MVTLYFIVSCLYVNASDLAPLDCVSFVNPYGYFRTLEGCQRELNNGYKWTKKEKKRPDDALIEVFECAKGPVPTIEINSTAVIRVE
jgi:hypothetical protein